MSVDPVHCRRCGASEPAISGRVPFRDPLRSEIVAGIGQRCWSEWQAQQLRILNEYRLNLAEERSRAVLESAARSFLHLGGDENPGPATGPEKAKELGNL